MVWYFMAGFISGAVGMSMFARWFVNKYGGGNNGESGEDNRNDPASGCDDREWDGRR